MPPTPAMAQTFCNMKKPFKIRILSWLVVGTRIIISVYNNNSINTETGGTTISIILLKRKNIWHKTRTSMKREKDPPNVLDVYNNYCVFRVQTTISLRVFYRIMGQSTHTCVSAYFFSAFVLTIIIYNDWYSSGDDFKYVSQNILNYK